MSEQMERDEAMDEWLREAIRELQREREPGEMLEERTVHALRSRGVLSASARGLRWSWLIAGAAASLALFACGVVTGQWLSDRNTAEMLAAQQRATLAEKANIVEQTGSAYVAAMTRLAEANATPGTAETLEARRTALQMLHLAANEVVRLAPNDPIAVKILQGFDQHAAQQTPVEKRERRRQIVWF
jgi:hypothetical protein